MNRFQTSGWALIYAEQVSVSTTKLIRQFLGGGDGEVLEFRRGTGQALRPPPPRLRTRGVNWPVRGHTGAGHPNPPPSTLDAACAARPHCALLSALVPGLQPAGESL